MYINVWYIYLHLPCKSASNQTFHVGKCTGPMDPSWVINYQSSPQQWHYWWLSWSPIMVQEIRMQKPPEKYAPLCALDTPKHSTPLHQIKSSTKIHMGKLKIQPEKCPNTKTKQHCFFPNPYLMVSTSLKNISQNGNLP